MTIAEQITRAKTDYDEVYAAGKAAQRKAFANAHQQNGERTNYNYAYYGVGWTDDTFWLEHNIKVSAAECMFYNCAITNLAKILTECGKTIDFSGLKRVYRPFMNADITVFPELDFSNSTAHSATFRLSSAVTIPKFIVSEKCAEYDATFQSCANLVTLIVEGTIAANGFDTSDCTKLDKASLTSIINSLSSTTSGLSVTMSKKAVNNAFAETVDGTEYIGSESPTWMELVNTKTNWTIVLA